MSTDTRDLAFIKPAAQFAGLTLRPFSAGTMAIARALNLTFLTGGETAEADKQEQLTILLFIQSAPIDEVKRAVQLARTNRQAFLDDCILPFSLALPVTAFPKVFAELETSLAAVSAAQFDTKPTGGTADPNA